MFFEFTMSLSNEGSAAVPLTANSNFTHRPTAAAVLRANRFAKLVLHAAKMSLVAREH